MRSLSRKPPAKSRAPQIDTKYQRYEQLKAIFAHKGLPPREYERACRSAAKKAGL